jgi:Tol biopolymer transport system component
MSNLLRYVLPTLMLAVLLGGCGPNGPIVFVSDRDSIDANGNGTIESSERNLEIYSINPDGTGLQRLTNNPATDTRPGTAADGRRIAFDSTRSGNIELHLMRSDGSGVSRVTDRGAPDVGPSFSAGGNRLAYAVRHATTLPGGQSEGDIWTVNTDGTETTRLTFDRELDEFDPAFAPDGSKIAFVSGAPGGVSSSYDVFVIDTDGSNMINLTAGSGGAGAEDSDPAFSPNGQKITFTSDRGGGTEIWVMNADGSNPQQLTNASGRDEHPSFSPDGTKIAFTARRGGNVDIYTMNADGSGQTRLTDDAPLNERDEVGEWMAITPAGAVDTYIDSGPPFVGSSPDVNFTYSGAPALGGQVDGFRCRLDAAAFAACAASGRSFTGLAAGEHTFEVRAYSNGTLDPTRARYSFEVDPTRIVFASERDGQSEIYSINADGTAPSRLTNNAATDTDPALSPDGATVAFASDRDGDSEIYLSAADGSGQAQKLTNNSAPDSAPSFSPDGSTIFFSSARDGNSEVYAMNAANGSAQTNLTTNPASDRDPSPSPSGSTIVFSSDRAGGNEDIYSMAANGSGVLRLTTAAAADALPDFSPDGTRIAFTRDVSPGPGQPSDDDVWMMNPDGSAQTNITNHPRGIDDRQPSFRPDGAKIAYQDAGDIYIQDPDGTARTRLTAVAATDSVPDWGVVSTAP